MLLPGASIKTRPHLSTSKYNNKPDNQIVFTRRSHLRKSSMGVRPAPPNSLPLLQSAREVAGGAPPARPLRPSRLCGPLLIKRRASFRRTGSAPTRHRLLQAALVETQLVGSPTPQILLLLMAVVSSTCSYLRLLGLSTPLRHMTKLQKYIPSLHLHPYSYNPAGRRSLVVSAAKLSLILVFVRPSLPCPATSSKSDFSSHESTLRWPRLDSWRRSPFLVEDTGKAQSGLFPFWLALLAHSVSVKRTKWVGRRIPTTSDAFLSLSLSLYQPLLELSTSQSALS